MRRLAVLLMVLGIVSVLLVGCGSSRGTVVTSAAAAGTMAATATTSKSPGFDATGAEAALDSAPVGGGIRLETGTGPVFITKVKDGFLGTADPMEPMDPGMHYATAGEAIERCVQGFGTDLRGWSIIGAATTLATATTIDAQALVAAATPISWKELAAGPPVGKLLKVVGTIPERGFGTEAGGIHVDGDPDPAVDLVFKPMASPETQGLPGLPKLSMSAFHAGDVILYGKFTAVGGIQDTNGKWTLLEGFEVAVVKYVPSRPTTTVSEEETYKASCEDVDIREVLKNPGDYNRTDLHYKGKVVEIRALSGDTTTVDLAVNGDHDAILTIFFGPIFPVTVPKEVHKGSSIEVWGECQLTFKEVRQDGRTYDVPALWAHYLSY